MCGIAGQFCFTGPDQAAVMRATRALAHRGPDAEGFWSEGPVALGHRRLSIIDLAGGAQPMLSQDRTLAVVFNGEIYNYRELARELEQKGRRFETASDTEVLLQLYAEYGEDFVEKLEGMFALAIWDAPRQRLVAARDRFGEKPFVYCAEPGSRGKLTFASELRALVQAVGPRSVDREALSDYLELLYVPAPRTIYAGISKLPAGHLLIADQAGLQVLRYWSPPVPGTEAKLAPDYGHRLQEALRAAVRLRLRSDVPIAALLSGGIDSSVVVALMAQELGPGVKTFSVGFGAADDELPFARMVAERWQTDHHEIQVSSDVVVQATEALGAYGEPFGDSSAVPAVAVCQEVAREVKVVLTGDGGDELFAGYGVYRRLAKLPTIPEAELLNRAVGCLPDSALKRRLGRLARATAAKGAAKQRALAEVFPARERFDLLGLARVAGGPEQMKEKKVSGVVDAALAFDLGVYLPEDLLPKMDIAAMRWGLESRAPFLDSQLAALAVPPAIGFKQDAHEGKHLLRAAAKELLPETILQRPKRGFGSPVEAWLAGPLRPMATDLLRSPDARIRQWLDGKAIDGVLDEVLVGRGNGHQGWALLALEVWARGA